MHSDDVKIRSDFSKRLGWALSHAGVPDGKLRRAAVAKKFNVSVETTRKWLTGLVLPDPWRILAIAEELGVCAEYLLTGKGPRTVFELNKMMPEPNKAAWADSGQNDYSEEEKNLIALHRKAPVELRTAILYFLETGERLRVMEMEMSELRNRVIMQTE